LPPPACSVEATKRMPTRLALALLCVYTFIFAFLCSDGVSLLKGGYVCCLAEVRAGVLPPPACSVEATKRMPP